MPEPTIGDMERWLLRRGITLGEYEAMPWVRRDFLYSEFRGEWGEDPAGVRHETSLEEMRRELRERFERLKKGNPSPSPQVCNLYLLRLNLKSLATRAALAEMMWHGCYEHGHKTACEGIVDARKAVDEMADAVIRELRDCLEARRV